MVCVNVAVTDRAWLMVTVQVGLVPEHTPPDQPENDHPELAVAALTVSPTWAVRLEMTPATGAVRTAALRLFWAVSTSAPALETCACCCWIVAGRLTDGVL